MALPFAAWLLLPVCSRARKTASVHLPANLGFPGLYGKLLLPRRQGAKKTPPGAGPDGVKGEEELLEVGTAP